MEPFYEFTEEQKKGIEKRTKIIEDSIAEEGNRQLPFIPWLYLVEARLCYVYGMDISCVVMMIMTFEELFRSILSLSGYEVTFEGNKIRIDRLDFYELLKIAQSRSWITKTEYNKLDKLRKIRNKFTHVKEAKIENGKQSLNEISRQSMTAELFMPTVNFDGLAEQAVKLNPIFFRILDRTTLYQKFNPFEKMGLN